MSEKDSSAKVIKELLIIAKWGVASFIALLISGYLTTRLMITDKFLAILLAAAIVSIIIQAIRSHDNEFNFKMRWFIFYFLVYTTVIWAMGECVFPNLALQGDLLSSIIVGLTIAVVIVIIQKIGIKSRTLPWISIVLILILAVTYFGPFQSMGGDQGKNVSAVQEINPACPSPIGSLLQYENRLNTSSIGPALNNLLNASLWRVENNFRYCYKGRYKGQYPNWYYCDDMVISRWETGSSGTINYRWYTAVSAQLRPVSEGSGLYTLDSFICENGKKVTVDKQKPEFYVYDSKDGTRVRIDVSRDVSNISLQY